MANILADLSLRLSANTAELQKGLANAKTSLNNFKGSVSNIGGSVSGAFKEASKNVSQSLNAMTGGFSGMLQAGVSTFKGLIVGVRGFAAAFAATGIGALIIAITVAIAGLVAAFKRSGTASDEMEKALGFLKGVLNALVGLLVKVGEWLVKAFSDPKTAIQELWVAIKENLVTRFKGVVDFFVGGWEVIKNGAMGVAYAIKGIFSEDAKKQSREYFKEMADGLGRMGEGFLEITTGKTLDDLKEFGKQLKAAGDEGVRIAGLENDLWAKKTAILEQNGTAERKLGALREEIAATDDKSTEDITKKQDLISKALVQQNIINKNNIALAQSEYELLKAQLEQKSSGNLIDEDAYALAEKKKAIDDERYQANMANMALLTRGTALESKLVEDKTKGIEEYSKLSKEAEEKITELRQRGILLNIKEEEEASKAQAGFAKDELLRQVDIEAQLRKNAAIKAGGGTAAPSDLAKIASDQAEQQKQIWSNYYAEIGNIGSQFEKERADSAAETAKEALAIQLADETLSWKAKLDLADKGLKAGLLKEQEHEDAVATLKEERLAQQMEMIQLSADTISNIWQASMNSELKAAGDNEKKKDEIRRKYARKEKAMAIVMALINGALAFTKALTGAAPPANFIMAALVSAATAAQIAVIASQPLAKGGIAYGKTLATVGEYPGASTNPEIIAPLDKLKGLLASPFSQFGEVKFVIEQDKLVGILERADKKNIYF